MDAPSSSSAAVAAAPAAPPKAPRSQFLQKLHSILENPLDPSGLRWVTDDSFEISSKDAVAIHALSPAFEFHSLSSFIRQLSYYSFRRLSDRRRSTERRNSNPGYVLFQHPSGFFVRGDPSQLNKIVRKARTRSEKGRRASECSTASDETYPSALHPYPMPAWPPSTDYRPSFSTDRPFLQLPSLGSSFHTGAAPPPPPRLDTTQWRAYAPTTGAWVDPNRNDADRFGPPTRRSSLGEFKLSGTSTSTTTTMAGQPAPYAATLSSLQEEQRPRLRKAFSSTSVPTDEHGHPHPLQVYQDQHEQHHHAPQGFRGSPYPTPTFSPTSNTFFDAHPGYHHASASGVTATTSAFTSAPHMSYDASPFASSYHPIAPSQPSSSSLSGAATKGARALTHSYHTPSPDHFPLQQVVGLPALVETVPPLGHPAHPATTTSERHSPRSSTSYAPLPPMQARFASNSSATTSHAPWQPAQTLAPAQSQAQGYGGYASYAPLPTTTAPMSAPSQWSPAPIRSAY